MSSDSLYNPCKRYGPHTTNHPPTPQKKSTIRPFNLIYCGWIYAKSMRYVSYNQHINRVTRRFTFMRRAQNADTHALKQHRLSQNICPVGSSFLLVIASDMHLETESEKRAKNVHFHTTKNIQIQSTFFSLFLDEFLDTDLRQIFSLTCRGQYR